ncbi:hypothetical protein ACFW6Q_15220 [Streptomyces sp. NPDC058737]|uniref:hypothetical protein n=1 Tax=Streptomyces sp. NPDC058737 TaxID=3346617 RepID=UPI0036756A9C
MLGPEVLVFDVNETLTDMSALAPRLADVGLPGQLLPQWFAGVLRDGIALTLAGGRADFATVARDALLTHLAREGVAPADPRQRRPTSWAPCQSSPSTRTSPRAYGPCTRLGTAWSR